MAPLRRGAAAAAGAVGLLGVLVSGCTSDPAAAPPEFTSSSSTGVRSTAAPTTGTTPSTGTATTPGTRGDPELTPEEQEVADAYRAAVAAFVLSGREPVDPNLRAMDETMTGVMLSELRDRRLQDQRSGQATRPGPENLFAVTVRAVRVEGDRAEVDVCVVDDIVRFDLLTGRVIDDDIAVVTETGLMEQIDGVWKLARRSIGAEVEGASCE